MNTEILQTAGIDYNDGLMRLLDNKELYEQSLINFDEDGLFAHAIDCIKYNDYDGVYYCLQTLKGVTGMLGITSFFYQCDTIISLLVSKNYANLVSEFDTLTTVYNSICAAIAAASGDNNE